MTLYEETKSLLTREPRARERRGKDNGIRLLLIEKYPSLASVDKSVLIEVLRAYNSYDRIWRKVTLENPELRGKDYEDGYDLAVQEMDKLGYHVQPANYKV